MAWIRKDRQKWRFFRAARASTDSGIEANVKCPILRVGIDLILIGRIWTELEVVFPELSLDESLGGDADS